MDKLTIFMSPGILFLAANVVRPGRWLLAKGARKMLKKLIQILVKGLLVILLVAAMGCSSNDTTDISSVNAQPGTTYKMISDGNDGYLFQDADGKQATANDVAESITAGEDIGFDIDQPSSEDTPPDSRWEITKFGWRLEIRKDLHDINSVCYNGKYVRHINVNLQKVPSGPYVAKLHIWMFWRNGLQIGLWDKTSGFCKATKATYKETNENFKKDISKYVKPAIATALAAALAFLVIYVLIPGGVIAAAV